MSEADDLARRFLSLWAEYLNALTADPNTAEPLRRWFAPIGAAVPGFPPGDQPRPPAGAAAAAGASGERDAALAELARRIDELGERVAALERGQKSTRPKAARSRRRNSPSRG